jgi:hypothetical protein
MSNSDLSSATCELDVLISATPHRVWQALIEETQCWWPSDFATSERTKRFVIEPTLGGRVYEDYGSGEGLLWYTVIGLEVGTELILAGHLLPPFGGPATTALRLSLFARGSSTLLKIRDDRFGVLGCDSPIEGWRFVFESGLRHFLESLQSS